MIYLVVCRKCKKHFYGDLLYCPHCGTHRLVEKPDAHEDEALPLVRFISLRVTSGELFQITHVMLYDSIEVEAIRSLEARAQEKLGPLSIGLGILGSPGVAIGGMLAITAFESILSKSSKKEGLELLRHAQEKMTRLREKGELIPTSEISRVHLPIPSEWRREVEKNTRIRKPTMLGEKAEDQKVISRMVVSGDPFITVKTAEGNVVHIMWEKIQSYEPEVI